MRRSPPGLFVRNAYSENPRGPSPRGPTSRIRPMRTLHHASKTLERALADFGGAPVALRELTDAVAAILADVRARGDEAVAYYAAKFDGAKLRGRDFRVPVAEIAAASKKLPSTELKALSVAHENIVAFNQRNLPEAWTAKNQH